MVAAHEHKYTIDSPAMQGVRAGANSERESTALARGLAWGLQKMVQEQRAQNSRSGGAAAKTDLNVDDMEAIRCMREVGRCRLTPG